MPRVLHVINDLALGGATTQLRLLAERGEAIIATRRRPPAGERLPVTWLGGRFRRDPFARHALVRLLREHDVDAVQSWDGLSARLCRAATVPRVHTARGSADDSFWAAEVDGVIASDESIAGRLAAEGIASRVVPNAYAPELASNQLPERSEARRRLRAAGADVADDAPVIVTVARLEDPAGLKEIVWAADLVRAVRPGLRLLIAGDGPAQMAGRRFAAKACEPGLVVWLGGWRDLPTLYAAADIVWCGRGGGANPTPAVEAWAAGKPTVVADALGRVSLPESEELPPRVLAWDDRAAWGRTTKRLFEQPDRAAEIGAMAAEQVRTQHDPDRVAALHREAIDALLVASGSSA